MYTVKNCNFFVCLHRDKGYNPYLFYKSTYSFGHWQVKSVLSEVVVDIAWLEWLEFIAADSELTSC